MTSISHALGWVVVGCWMLHVERLPPRTPMLDVVATAVASISFAIAATTFWSAP